MKSRQRIIKQLADKGLKHEDVSRSVREAFSYYEDMSLLYRYMPKGEVAQGLGTRNAEILVVSDKPDEFELGFGFSGYGQYAMYLMLFMQKMGINIHDIYWTSVFKTQVKQVTMDAIKEEMDDLYNEIYVVKPTIIIALGTTAISALAGEPIKIDSAIGEEFYFESNGKSIRVIPIEHPRKILEQKEEELKKSTGQVWNGVKIISDLL